MVATGAKNKNVALRDERISACLLYLYTVIAIFAFCNAAHTVGGLAGIATASVPMASVIALMTAAGAAIAPASPHPLMPRGLEGDFVTVVSNMIGPTQASAS